MNFTLLDWSAIVGYLAITLVIGAVVSPSLQPQCRRLLRLRPQRELVAGRHVDGRDHLRCRHAAGRHRTGLLARHLRELAVVGLPAVGHDDGLSLCPAVATLRPADRRTVRGDPLLRQARGVPARLSRHLSRAADELRHPRLGDEGDDQYRRDDVCGHAAADQRRRLYDRALRIGVERQRRRGTRHLRFLPDPVHRTICFARWPVGRALD